MLNAVSVPNIDLKLARAIVCADTKGDDVMMLSRQIRYPVLLVLAVGCAMWLAAAAQGQTTVGQGKVSICKEIDDDWKCVGQSSQWEADKAFNVLFENPTPVGVDFIGIIFYKQGADGKDAEFVNEYEQNIGEQKRKYATVGDELKLPAGTYTVYIITWGKRELLEHHGNLKEYLARTVLTVK
ncbi:MAG: hypothetical protein JOZ52_02230 [Acidobacteria bacterium]|nr:hypothetical protein [Acidobacteriota bacterium]